MGKQVLKFSKIRDVKSPSRANSTDAGIDWFVPQDFPVTRLEPGQSVLIPSGIRVHIPEGHMLMAANKSGVCTKKGLIIGAAIVDEGYENELHIHLIRVAESSTPQDLDAYVIKPGDKIAQFILIPVNYAIPEEITDEEYESQCGSSRGKGGFGSSGTK